MAGRIPYVILIGNVGAGKSALVEKVTGMTGLSSAASTSVTKTSDAILSVDHSLLICDTPGTNSITDKFSSNVELARALNFKPVNLLLITVKADVRIESVAKGLREYMELWSAFFQKTIPDRINWVLHHSHGHCHLGRR